MQTEQNGRTYVHTMTPSDILSAWRKHVPDVTDLEAAALLPLVENRRGSMLHSMLAGYRAGRRDGSRNDVAARCRAELAEALGIDVDTADWNEMLVRVRELWGLGV
jgi:hypothetical protein